MKPSLSGGGFNDSQVEYSCRLDRGHDDLMPYAKGMSAKSHEFDDDGNETRIDYLSPEGILATKRLKERVRD